MQFLFTLLFLFLAIDNSHASLLINKATINGASFKGGTGGGSSEKKILPIGDSITKGVSGDTDSFGYRNHLQDALGIGVYNFVGGFSDPSSDATYDVNHSGVGGNTSTQIESRLSTDLFNYFQGFNDPENKILIHAGTNDIFSCSVCDAGERAAIVQNIEDMIDAIVNENSSINIYVALIIPHTNATYDTDITNLNTDIATMVTAYGKANLYYVDMNSAFKDDTFTLCGGNWASNCIADGVHPNDTGYQVMALQWASCIASSTNVNCNGN